MVALGEMAAHLLYKKGFVDYAIRSVEPAFRSRLELPHEALDRDSK